MKKAKVVVAAVEPPDSSSSSSSSRTHPVIWCAAVVCATFAVVVIVGGVVIFLGFTIIRPKVPSMSVRSARLERFSYDQSGLLALRMSLALHASNHGGGAHASFYNLAFVISLQGMQVARLVASPFTLRKNASLDLRYQISPPPLRLPPPLMRSVDASLKQNLVTFDLHGAARTRWHVGSLGSAKFSCRLSCQLHFRLSDSSYLHHRCSSTAH